MESLLKGQTMSSKEYSLLLAGSDIDTVAILTTNESFDGGSGGGGGKGSSSNLIPNYNWNDYDIHHGLNPDVYVPADAERFGTMERHASKPGRMDRYTVLYAIPDFPQSQIDHFFMEEDIRQRAFVESNWQLTSNNNLDLPYSNREELEKIPEFHRGFDKYSSAFRIDKSVGRETAWLRHGNPYGYDSANRILYATSHQYPFTFTVADSTFTKELPFEPPYEERNASHTSCVLFPTTARFEITEVNRWDTPAFWMHGLIDWDVFKVDEHWMTYQRLRPFPIKYLNSVTPEPSVIDYWHQFNLMSCAICQELSNPFKVTSSKSDLVIYSDTIESSKPVESLDLAPRHAPAIVPALGTLTAQHRMTLVSFSQEIVEEIDYIKHIRKNRSLLFLINAQKTKNFGTVTVMFRVSGLPKDAKVGVIKGQITSKVISDSVIDITVTYSQNELVSLYIENINSFKKISIEPKSQNEVTATIHCKIYGSAGFDTLPFIDKVSKSFNKITLEKI
ncbi:hypothetical protein [Yersinia ruckeri]|uniref:hypothetical protein n=1 Tax=Yersinia ruckeri TaxID=29486 RepID=UPI002238593F|nr:hypothetical protein [Yersinia ruckeri]MCW6598665.1 hypothetical protein [Yersinia ruckeri]